MGFFCQYAVLILENLVPNIAVEMCFILQLLTVKETSTYEGNGIIALSQKL